MNPDETATEKWDLRLYVAGHTDKSVRAIKKISIGFAVNISKASIQSRSSIFLNIRSSRKAIKFLQFRPSFGAFPSP